MQTDFASKFGTALSIAEKYGLSTEALTTAMDELPDFRIAVPLVGGFSTGKSSLINAAVGENLLATGITPKTAVPTEITSGSDTVVIVSKDKSEKTEALSEFDRSMLSVDENLLVKIYTSNPFFKQIPSVKLVDMPGFDSGYDAHNRAIDEYMPKSLAYILTVSAEEGTLRESVIAFLNELKLCNMPVYAVITKSGKVPPDTLDALKEHISKTVSRFLNIKDVKVAVTNAKGDVQIDSFKEILFDLQNQSEALGERYFAGKLKNGCANIEKYITDRLSQADMSLEDLKLQREQAQQSITELQHNVEREKERFSSELRTAVDRIKSRVSNDLNRARGSIESLLLSDGDVGGRVNSIVRNAVMSGIQSDVEPRLQKYIRNVGDMINTSVYGGKINVPDNTAQTQQIASTAGNVVVPVVTTIATTALTAFASTSLAVTLGLSGAVLGPIGAAVGALVGGLISSGIMNASRQKQETERRSAASQQAGQIISSACADACGKVEEQINGCVSKINEGIDADISEKRTLLEKALVDTEEKLRAGESERARVRAELNADLETIRSIENGI